MTTDTHCSSVCTLCGGRYRWEQTAPGEGFAPVHLDGPCEPQTPAEVARIMADPDYAERVYGYDRHDFDSMHDEHGLTDWPGGPRLSDREQPDEAPVLPFAIEGES